MAANLQVQWIQINGITHNELQRQVRGFNNPEIDRANIPKFSGVMSEVYKWEQKVRSLIQLQRFPKGNEGILHNDYNGTVAQINWGGKPQWNALTYGIRNPLNVPNNKARQLLGDPTLINQQPPLPQQVWTNPLLDGLELILGLSEARPFHDGTGADNIDPCDSRSVIHQVPFIQGKYAAGNGDTTQRFQPQNRCERSAKFVNTILEKFEGTASTWLNHKIQTDPNSLPRTFENHRWEGQTEDPEGKYGLFAQIKRRFIPANVKEAILPKLEQLTIWNYERPSSSDGKQEMRHMASFIETYKEILYIAEIDYGCIEI